MPWSKLTAKSRAEPRLSFKKDQRKGSQAVLLDPLGQRARVRGLGERWGRADPEGHAGAQEVADELGPSADLALLPPHLANVAVHLPLFLVAGRVAGEVRHHHGDQAELPGIARRIVREAQACSPPDPAPLELLEGVLLGPLLGPPAAALGAALATLVLVLPLRGWRGSQPFLLRVEESGVVAVVQGRPPQRGAGHGDAAAKGWRAAHLGG